MVLFLGQTWEAVIPYCIEAGGFRKWRQRDDSAVCDTCSHHAVDRPDFRCSCKKVRNNSRSLNIPSLL